MRLRQSAHLRMTASVALLAGAGIGPAFADCPNIPIGSVYVYVCSQTDNLGDGATITVNGGHTTVSTTGLTQIDNTVLGSPNAHQALLNGQFGLAGTSGQVSSTETETVSKGAG